MSVSQTQMPLFKLPIVITPDYRNNDKFQFVTGYTGGFAAEMCVHLTWEEKRELHVIESQQTFFNSLLMQSAQGAEVNPQDIMAKFAELSKQTKLVKIKYQTIRKKNSITRRGEKKKLQKG